MKLSIDEMDYLGLDEEHRYIRDDSADAAIIRQRRALHRQPVNGPNRAAFSLEAHHGPSSGLPGHAQGMRTAWSGDDRRIEDTRQEEW